MNKSKASAATSRPETSNKGLWIVSGTVMLAVCLGFYFWLFRGDSALARIQTIRAEMQTADGTRRQELRDQWRQAYDDLTPENREQVRNQWREQADLREAQQLHDFFALSPKEQVAQLDQEIKREEERRKEREKRQASGQRSMRFDRSGDRGNRVRNTSDDPNARRKSYLDRSTPQARAMRAEKQRLSDERRRQLGLPLSANRR